MTAITIDSGIPSVATERSEEIGERLRLAQVRLEELIAVRARIDGDRSVLLAERAQCEPLDDACISIEALFECGLSRAFWGERASDDEVRAHLQEVRRTFADLSARSRALSAQWEDACADVRRQQLLILNLQDELDDAWDDEQARALEWKLERDESVRLPHAQVLPWNRRQQDDARFRRTLAGSVAAALLLGLIVPFIELPVPERSAEVEVPERLVSLIQRQPPPPPLWQCRREHRKQFQSRHARSRKPKRYRYASPCRSRRRKRRPARRKHRRNARRARVCWHSANNSPVSPAHDPRRSWAVRHVLTSAGVRPRDYPSAT